MNESRSSRYHRVRRRASCAALALAGALLTGLLASGGAVRLREVAGDAAALYTLVLILALETAVLPVVWYRTFVVERQFGLVRAPARAWLADYGRGVALSTATAVLASALLYRAMRAWPDWWWLPAAAGGVLLAAAIVWLAPLIVLPVFHRSRPVARDALRHRLQCLSRRIGIDVLNVHEWSAGAQDRRAHASLAGAGATRRVLLSPTLLADYTDDEIEVVLAHEMGHHVHRDLVTTLGAEFVVLLTGLLAASAALARAWEPLGFASPADPAGLPLVLLVAGGTRLVCTPLLNALSRHNERRADRFALEVVSRPEAFIGAVRRMAAQNLAEEHPSRAAFWLFHTHPTVEERIMAASARRVTKGSI